MTARQRRSQIAEAIRIGTETHGFAPSLRELSEVLRVSPSCVAQHLDAMRARGEVAWEDGKGRTLRLVPRAAE